MRALLDKREGGYGAVPMGSGDGKQARASSEGNNGSGNIGTAGDPDLSRQALHLQQTSRILRLHLI